MIPAAAATGSSDQPVGTWIRWDEALAGIALAGMTLIPLVEMAARPLLGRGVDNAPVLVQHLGLVMAMFGALAAARTGQLTTLGGHGAATVVTALRTASGLVASAVAAFVCGLLAQASWRFVRGEIAADQPLAYGMPVWWVMACMPLGFALLGLRIGSGVVGGPLVRLAAGALLLLAGWACAAWGEGVPLPFSAAGVALLIALLAGAPVFAVLGGLALALFWSEGLPLASVALSHYQITVNPSLPALPLFTLAGLILARTGAAGRLSELFVAMFGGGVTGTVIAAAVLCSVFTAITGGSGVTILALGGLLLPLLHRTGYAEKRGIGLVTSASALGVLLAPSVPLIMYAVLARVPIADMFLAGLLPAMLMVACLLVVGGFLRRDGVAASHRVAATPGRPDLARAGRAAWAAKWELAAPVVAVGSILAGLATPTESAALTAAYAVATQAVAHRELGARLLWRCLVDCATLIGGVMLILGMALALTNYLVDTGLPDRAVEWVQAVLPDKHLFLLALCFFLFAAAALMEIYAALVVLVPLLLPLTRSYGIDPVHFGIIFLAAMEVGFLCPPAGMNLYFASAMFGKPIRYVAAAVGPAMLAIFLGTVLIALWPPIATALPSLLRP